MQKQPIKGATGKGKKEDNVRTGEENLERKANAGKNIKNTQTGQDRGGMGDMKSSDKKG